MLQQNSISDDKSWCPNTSWNNSFIATANCSQGITEACDKCISASRCKSIKPYNISFTAIHHNIQNLYSFSNSVSCPNLKKNKKRGEGIVHDKSYNFSIYHVQSEKVPYTLCILMTPCQKCRSNVFQSPLSSHRARLASKTFIGNLSQLAEMGL